MNHQFPRICVALSTAILSAMAAESSTNAPAAAKPPAATPKPPSPWHTTASINAAVSRGNADTLLMGAAINSLRKWDKNEIALGADGTFGSNSDPTTRKETTTAQNYGLYAQYNRMLSDRVYLGLRSDARQDRIAFIDYRATVAPAFGYHLIKNDRLKLKLENGPAFIFERLKGAGTANYLTLRVAEEVQWKINDRASIVQSMEYLPQVEDFGNYVVNFNLGLSTKITEKASATITFQDFYRSVPAPGRRGNDLRLMAGISYSF
jgi:putative salt-induced outer membrane protein YdiY